MTVERRSDSVLTRLATRWGEAAALIMASNVGSSRPTGSRALSVSTWSKLDGGQRSTITSAAVTGNRRIGHLEPVREPDETAPC